MLCAKITQHYDNINKNIKQFKFNSNTRNYLLLNLNLIPLPAERYRDTLKVLQ